MNVVRSVQEGEVKQRKGREEKKRKKRKKKKREGTMSRLIPTDAFGRRWGGRKVSETPLDVMLSNVERERNGRAS